MLAATQIGIPTLVRIKPGALARTGLYLARAAYRRIALLSSEAMPPAIAAAMQEGLDGQGIEVVARREVRAASFEEAAALLPALPGRCDAVVGLGGGRALDIAKYLAFLARLPFLAAPTSLSNDGFCSPSASLTVAGRRRSLPCAVPFGVVVDTEVCLRAPEILWLSGVGDLVAKVTAVHDWKLAFHARGEPVNDFAALLSDATVFQFMARPARDLEGMRLLATALMLNGIAMEIAGSSRPASGSEHLISHALDQTGRRPRLHGLQVGTAAYVVSRLQGRDTDPIAAVLDATRFWDAIRADPFSLDEWLEAVRVAPEIKHGVYTVLSSRDCVPEVESILRTDPRLHGCFA
ncbi:dehydrogenase [Sorangium cellulosum]|uniref:Dehydrogenase n=1 Tax=Sorangium cellulosum TaxID=56 RepID=A0A4P2Q4Y6_SORCE|nr:iron-containing alcohol dehydrogenase family protein [Sorangium cellulosum]AUX24003.1 dehydrogenase [Sorangium cellulosum]